VYPDSLLTIELGTRCNNRCSFCPQHHLRCVASTGRSNGVGGGAGETGDLSTSAVVRRLEDGRNQGFSRIAFTGGEPTVRLDLARLVRAAAGLGYAEIGITTNGRMFAAGDLAAELVEAGLNRISFSLHGPEPIHDSLSGVAGAYRQLEAGMASVRATAAGTARELQLHSVTLLLPQNVDLVREAVRLAAGMGACIHILQPFIASRPNLHVAADYHLSIRTLARAVAQAGLVATRHSTRVKPYNIPYCELEDLSGLELQPYRLATFRRQEGDLHDLSAFGQRQFYRVDRCPTCPTPCPGYRIEQFPREKMADAIVEAVTDWRTRGIAVPGLDLLDEPDLARCLARMVEAGFDVVPVSGGRMWCAPARYVRALAQAGIREVVHVLRTEWDGTGWDGKPVAEPEPGNEDATLHLAQLLADAGIRSRLLVAVPDLPEFPYPLDLPLPFTDVVVAVPIGWRGVVSPSRGTRHSNGSASGRNGRGTNGGNGGNRGGTAGLLNSVGPAALNAAETLSRHIRVELATFDALRVLDSSGLHWQKAFSARFGSTDWSARMVSHRFSTREYAFLFWSNLFFLY